MGSVKLQLGVPDTILFKDGAPQAWLFTSKTGDVVKKRSLRKTSIRDRFTRLSTSNPNNPQQRLATVRFMDGTVRNLGRDSFKEMMAKFPATEPGILSIQCYVQGKGTAGTVYRNSYKVVNDKGLVVTGTSSFTTLVALAEQREAPSSTWSQREIKLEKCNASSITTALDAVTFIIVRYLESQQDRPTRVLHLQSDYIIDAAGQIWLTWISETTIAVADAAQDLRLANVAAEGPRGRGEFLGPQTALAMQRDFGGPPSPVRKPRRRAEARSAGDNSGSNSTSLMEDITKGVDRAAEVVELPRGAVGGGGAGGIAEMFSRTEAVKSRTVAGVVEQSSEVGNPSTLLSSVALVAAPGREGKRGEMVNASQSTMTVGVRTGEAWEADGRTAPGTDTYGRHFPSSFACAGDYCAIRVLVRER